MTAIIFLAVLAVLVFVHELGHFIAAKKLGIRVDEFAIGFPPKIFSKKVGETVYSINAIPFGGFVKIFGENPDEESLNGPDSARSFVKKPKWRQAVVLVAGVLFNFIFAWLLIVTSFAVGVPASSEDYSRYSDHTTPAALTITSVSPGSPAEKAGLKPGDEIVSLTNKENGKHAEVNNPENNAFNAETVQNFIKVSEANTIAVGYCRKDVCDVAMMNASSELVPGKFAIGIAMDMVGVLTLPLHLAVVEGTRFTFHIIGATAIGFIDFVAQVFQGEGNLATVTGPVGIAGLVGDASKLGFTYFLMFTALISINLGVINLVPFPALDGGRLLFVVIEAVTRKSIKPRIANMLNSVGFVLLLLLMLVVTYRDVAKLFIR